MPALTPIAEQGTPPRRVLVMAASTRSGSLNQALARVIACVVEKTGKRVGLVDLVQYPMPLYDGDLETRNGVPPAARHLSELLKTADVLVVVSPEYNGTFTPLLKNTVDWMTRVDKAILSHVTVALAAASPGKSGGRRGLEMVLSWLLNMGVRVADEMLSVGSAELDDNGDLVGLDSDGLDDFVSQVLGGRLRS